jgi:gamma-glutamyltranspeptidase/glutathione hydrolase
VGRGMEPTAAVEAPRVHFEEGALQAEPGVDEEALRRLEMGGLKVVRWDHRNLFFGGVQAVARDRDGRWIGAGDPRRGGAVAVA